MVIESIPVTMTGEQCKHLVNMFIANHAEKSQFSNLDRAARKLDICDNKNPNLTREWMRRISKFEQGITNDEFLFSLAQETTYGDLLGEIRHWTQSPNEVSSSSEQMEKLTDSFLSAVEEMYVPTE